MSNELGVGYVSVVAETSKLASQLNTIFGGVNSVAGKHGKGIGQALSKGIADTAKVDLSKLEKDFVEAEKKRETAAQSSARTIESARRAEAIANSGLVEAEMKVAASSDALVKAKARVTTAQGALTKAQREYGDGSPQVLKAQKELTTAQGALTTAEQKAASASTNLLRAKDRVAAASDKVRVAEAKGSVELERAGKAVDAAKAALDDYHTSQGKVSRFSWKGLTTGVTDMARGVVSAVQPLGVKVGTALTDVGSRVKAMGDGVSGVAQKALRGDLRGAFTDVSKVATTTASGVGSAFSSVGDRISTGVSNGLGKLKGLFTRTRSESQEAGSQSGESFKQGIGPAFASAASSAGNIFMGNLKAILASKAILGVVGMVKGTIQGAFSGGWTRLANIENAEVKLKAIYQTEFKGQPPAKVTEATAKAMDSVSKSVDGTRFALSDAADMASVLAASQIEAGEGMERWLKVTANAATFNNKEFSEMQQIIQKVAQQGKVTGETFDSMPIAASALAKELGVSQAEVRKLASEGKISADQFLDAMEGTLGDAAQLSGTTFGSMAANLKTAFNASAAAILKPIKEGLKPLLAIGLDMVKSFRDNVAKPLGETLDKAIQPKIQALTDGFAKMKESGFTSLLEPIKKGVGVVKTFFGAFVEGFGGMDSLKDVVKGLIPILTGPLGIIKDAVLNTFSSIDVGKLGSTLGSMLKPVLTIVGDLSKSLSGVLTTGLKTVVPLVMNLLDLIAPLVVQLVNQLAPIVSDLFSKLLPPLVSIFDLVVQVVGKLISAVAPLVTMLVGALAPIISDLFSAIIPPLSAALETVAKVIEAVVVPVLTWLIDTIVKNLEPVLNNLSGTVKTVFDFIGRTVQNALNIVSGLVKTVMAIIKGDWSGAWDGIKQVGSAIWGQIKNLFSTFSNLLKDIWKVLSSTLSGVWDTLWSGMKKVGSGAWDWIKDTVTDVFNKMKSAVTGTFEKMKDAVSSVWDKIKSAVAKPINAVINFVNDGIVGSYNWVADKLNMSQMAKMATLPGYYTGGFTGPIDPRRIAGLVHGREYVLTADETDAMGGPSGVESWKSLALGRGYAKGGAVRPVPQGSSGWNGGRYRSSGKWHGGLDFPAPIGQAIQAMWTGAVSKVARLNQSYGYHTMLNHGGGVQTLYAHQSRIGVSTGQSVKAGQVIGAVGSTGNSTGPHLHLEVRVGGKQVDPTPYLQGASVPSGGKDTSGILHGVIDWLSDMKDKLTGVWNKFSGSFGGAGMWSDLGSGVAKKLLADFKGWAEEKLNPANWFGGYATGTRSAAPGLAWVGERGPELVRFRGGERVFPASPAPVVARNTRRDQRAAGTGPDMDAVLAELVRLRQALSSLTVVDSDGALVGRMRVEARGEIGGLVSSVRRR